MSGNGTRNGRDEGSASSTEGDLSARLKRLEADIDRTRPQAPPGVAGHGSSSSSSSAVGQAYRFSAEFVAGVIAGGIVGWLIDRLVGSSPWGLIVCLILGFCAGMLNLLRASGSVKPARYDIDR